MGELLEDNVIVKVRGRANGSWWGCYDGWWKYLGVDGVLVAANVKSVEVWIIRFYGVHDV